MGQVLKVLEGHTGFVIAVAISSDGGKIVSGSDDNTVRVWSTETGKVLACLLGGAMFNCEMRLMKSVDSAPVD